MPLETRWLWVIIAALTAGLAVGRFVLRGRLALWPTGRVTAVVGVLLAGWLVGLRFLPVGTLTLTDALVLAAMGLVAGARLGRISVAVLLAGLALVLVGAWLSADVGFWLAVTGVALLGGAVVLLLLTGAWSWRFAVGSLALAWFGTAGWSYANTQTALGELARSWRSLAFGVEPVVAGLLLTLLVGLIVFIIAMSRRSLAALGPGRRWLVIGLRIGVTTCLILALVELRMRQLSDNVTVLFVVDRSLSVPLDPDPDPQSGVSDEARDRRWRRIKEFIYESVAKRGAGHERDQTGVILFGRRPRLVLPPSDAPRLTRDASKLGPLDDPVSDIDPTYTDMAAALKLALASFPENTTRRLVLLSDGNENLGNAIEQAKLARKNGVQIDTIPLAVGTANDSEVLVQSVEAPPVVQGDVRVPVRVLIRNSNPRLPVQGTLLLRQGDRAVPIVEGQQGVVAVGKKRGEPAVVVLRPGLNSFAFVNERRVDDPAESFTYEAIFRPLGIPRADGKLDPLTGDRVQNNTATTHVIALGERQRVLLVHQPGQEPDLLIRKLTGDPKRPRFKVYPVVPAKLPAAKADLGVFLSNYDCIILNNVPAEDFTDDQMEMIRANTADQGCGLIMIGGKQSFGAGGWQGTAVEKALPVECDIKSLKVQGKGGLVLIMHASEMADGNKWQMEIAKLAVKKLNLVDMVGVSYYGNLAQVAWHVDFQQIKTANNRAKILRDIDRMTPGDMPDFNPFLKAAADKLLGQKDLATRHCIIISDGDPNVTLPNNDLKRLADAGATVTTVGVATHGMIENNRMADIAKATGGRFYNVKNPNQLPAIYIKETRIVSQSFIYESEFNPKVLLQAGPTRDLTRMENLFGFVRTSLRQEPSVQMAIEGPPTQDQVFPILAYWQYGLGRSVAFTSDARTGSRGNLVGWDRNLAESETYEKFWTQLVEWTLRSVESGKLALTTEFRDGKVRVLVDARDPLTSQPLTDLTLEAAITTPGAAQDDQKQRKIRFRPIGAGQYEAEFKADEAGSYFVNVVSTRRIVGPDGKEQVETDGIRAGVTMPYSPEFADLESNPALLKRLSDETGGLHFLLAEEAPNATVTYMQLAQSGELYRPGLPGTAGQQPIWFWLLFLAGLGLLADVVSRRITIEAKDVAVPAANLWRRLRRLAPVVKGEPETLTRLAGAKAAALEQLTARRARRFEVSEDAPIAAPPPGADAPTLAKPPTAPPAAPRAAPPPIAPASGEGQGEPEDFTARLMRAKKKARENIDPKRPSDKPDQPQ